MKGREANERIYALKKMQKIAGVYFPEICDLLHKELVTERERFRQVIEWGESALQGLKKADAFGRRREAVGIPTTNKTHTFLN